MRRLVAVILCACATSAGAVVVAGCEPDVRGGAILPDLSVTDVGPAVIVPGTRLVIHGTGFTGPEVTDLLVLVRGDIGGEPVEFAVPPERVDDETLVVSFTGQVADAIVRPDGRLVGRISVLRTPKIEAPEIESGREVDLRVDTALVPSVSAIGPSELYIGDVVTITGDGFLFAHEGASLVELTGTMTTDVPARVVEVDGLQIPAEPPDTDHRDSLAFTLTPDVLGIVPGRFEGQIRVVNTAIDGTQTASEAQSVSLPLKPPYVTAIDPPQASRGQWVNVSGRGFVAPDGLLQAAMVLVLEGTFTPRGGPPTTLAGPSALTLVPDLQLDNQTVSAVLRVQKDTEGNLRGLGLVAGRFEGTIAPLLLFGPDEVKGPPTDLVFDILPQKQVVYLRALPAFDGALEEFGLLVERQAIEDRILAVTTRDYEGVSIEFTWQEPTDYAEYETVELAGRDPNGTGLFGLDNTEGKDVGNLRFADVIGGYNAATQAGGYAAYGGVFPGEFMNLSSRAGDNPLASPRFDDIFEPVSPALGGKPAQRGESDESDQRAADIREAVRVLGNLIGSTISHEVGHSLGLANVEGQFHNIGDNPGWLMDAGNFRPFEERAELDGQGPAFFEPNSLDYLKAVLPLD
ncbi:MAG: hypothetical protein U1F43_22305 [Myxococcota bacterium]